eukprot:CAMPEP_0201159208 /NCGR_PEP_ID=MMETSP0851-20130426/38204_1 /ASSEMBLY_ACC=CAM_ASM_000631 /TAXON_ID=183588 /ORGANISM="Pseudo-nitzschia fraudulenta, Strain WWA7" /LENGTH=282 /DNA_ID=CAMNT_0047438021 /DNA_START=295 /DNA_END=1140 /DNA_ORIENTATION=+
MILRPLPLRFVFVSVLMIMVLQTEWSLLPSIFICAEVVIYYTHKCIALHTTTTTTTTTTKKKQSVKLDPVLRGRLSPKDHAESLALQDRQGPPQEFLVDALEARPVDVLSGVQLVQGADPGNVPGRRGPLVDVRRQFLGFPPEDPAGGLFLVEPLAVSRNHQVFADYGDGRSVELALDAFVLPEGALVDDECFELVLRVVLEDEFPPQRQLLLPRRFDGLDREEGRKGIEFGVLKVRHDDDIYSSGVFLVSVLLFAVLLLSCSLALLLSGALSVVSPAGALL